MKYKMTPTLSLVITPETPEEQALVNLMNKMSVRNGGGTIHNAGMTYAEGRRESINIEFVGAPSGQKDATDHDVKYDDAFGHPGIDCCRRCEATSMNGGFSQPCPQNAKSAGTDAGSASPIHSQPQ